MSTEQRGTVKCTVCSAAASSTSTLRTSRDPSGTASTDHHRTSSRPDVQQMDYRTTGPPAAACEPGVVWGTTDAMIAATPKRQLMLSQCSNNISSTQMHSRRTSETNNHAKGLIH